MYMKITYCKAANNDIECIYQLSKKLIDTYESLECINYNQVMQWVRHKIETCIDEYTVILADGKKAGYVHFYRNEEGEYEIDDLYIFTEFQNQGIGSAVIEKCCSSVHQPIILYVFIQNQRAVSLYRRLGFEIVKTVNQSRYIMKGG